MGRSNLAFTINEAAVLAQLPRRRVDRELERGVLRSTGTPKLLGMPALVYLEWLRGQPYELPVAMRRDLAANIEEAVGARRHTALLKAARISVNLRPALTEVQPLARRYADWKQQLSQDDATMGGELTFPDSRLTVRRVGSMLERGVDPSELREDYPYLTDDDLRFARLYVQAHPRAGRPTADQTAD